MGSFSKNENAGGRSLAGKGIGSNTHTKGHKAIFGMLCTLMGLVGGWGGDHTQKIKSAHASRAWPAAEGVIIDSGVEMRSTVTHSGENRKTSTSYFADIQYEYTVGKKEYFSNRVSLGHYASGNQAWVEKIARRYPEGKSIRVYYNPRETHLSVLEQGAPTSTYMPQGIGFYCCSSESVWRIQELQKVVRK